MLNRNIENQARGYWSSIPVWLIGLGLLNTLSLGCEYLPDIPDLPGNPHDKPIDPPYDPSDDERLREEFLEQMAAFAEPIPPMDTRITDESLDDDIHLEHYQFNTTATRVATGRILTPADNSNRLPVIIAIHNTIGTDVRTAEAEGKRWINDMVNHPDGHKFMVVAPTSPDFITGDDQSFLQYGAAMEEAYRNPGHRAPFLMDTVWDIHRLIDYLETRPDVDATRIGVVGFSKGGMEVQILAAVDTRITVAAPIIGVCNFAWAIENDQWQARADALVGAPINAARDANLPLNDNFMRDFYERVSPGLLTKFDGPNMLPLIAPRPLIILNGTLDPRNPLSGVDLAVTAARHAYDVYGVPEQLNLVTKNVGHRDTPFYEDAEAWLIRWLITEPPVL